MRLYLVGAGVIARTHVEATKHLGEDVQLRVAETNPSVLADFLAEYPRASGFDSAEVMLGAESPMDDDIVIVATPPFAHLEPTLLALGSGRHVLCEKPLAWSAAEADEMLLAARENNRLLGTCSTRYRGLPHGETVKRVIASGALGELYYLRFVTAWPRARAGIEYQPSSRWFLNSAMSGGGVLMDWGPYDVSTLFDLLRPVRVDVADAWLGYPRTAADPTDTIFDTESHCGAALRAHLRDGTIVHVAFERANATHGREFAEAELIGTHGALRWVPFDSQQPLFLRRERDGVLVDEQVEPEPRDSITPFDRPLVAFHAAVHGRGSVASTDEASVDELRLIRAIYDVAADGMARSVEVRGDVDSAATVVEREVV